MMKKKKNGFLTNKNDGEKTYLEMKWRSGKRYIYGEVRNGVHNNHLTYGGSDVVGHIGTRAGHESGTQRIVLAESHRVRCGPRVAQSQTRQQLLIVVCPCIGQLLFCGEEQVVCRTTNQHVLLTTTNTNYA